MQKITAVAREETRLDLLAAQAGGASRSQAARWIEQGLCLVNGTARQKPAFKVSAGDALELTVPDAEETPVEKEDIPLDILYEDADLAVVVKPCGMVVHPAAGNESGTLVNALLYHMEDLSGIGGVKRPGIVHRLDKDTSGLLMVAKNDLAHQGLSDQLRARTMEKHYLAVVDGRMREPSGRVDKPIARSTKDRKRMAVDPAGREAVTEWTLLENLKNAALLDVHILTGRTHQIRVHMQSLHHPVAGDPIYGQKNGVKAPRLMLHAYTLSFTHPRTGERLTFTAPPPEAVYRGPAKVAGGPRRAAALSGVRLRLIGRQLALRPMPAAQAHIAFAAAQHNLFALPHHFAVYHARVADGFFAAPADGLDLLDGVGPGQQPLAALEKLVAEITPQAVGDHRHVVDIHHPHQTLHLRAGEKLRLVHDQAVIIPHVEAVQVLHKVALAAKAAAAGDHGFAVTVVQRGA